jgi:hypothetical protein
MLVTQRQPMLDRLVGDAIASLDIPDNVYERAVARYEAVAAWLEERWLVSGVSGLIYPQGSFRLGTVVRPILADGEYDMDLVCRRDLRKESITQALLKDEVGRGLRDYAASRPEGSPRLEEGKRCWTLDYPVEPFHMDFLPSIPDLEATPDGLLITDREVRQWQHSNPVGFSEWFYTVMARELRDSRAVLAKQMEVEVEEVAEWKVKTTLQRAVQALKRHRDLHFVDRDFVPASIIITTLAGRAYRGGGDLYEVILAISGEMADYVEVRDGVLWVENPVQEKENFADRWRAEPRRADAFFEWIEAAHNDFASIGDDIGADRTLSRIAKSFGEGAKTAAAAALGNEIRDTRDRGALRVTSPTGALGAAAVGIPVRKHIFHGDPPASPTSP